ncbi:MAG: hypothetical protein QF535_07815 [Anaerolineales bacterium]|jgi:hypothetical protein|nr:hypothetical protein [Anaerolineales bacterium]
MGTGEKKLLKDASIDVLITALISMMLKSLRKVINVTKTQGYVTSALILLENVKISLNMATGAINHAVEPPLKAVTKMAMV